MEVKLQRLPFGDPADAVVRFYQRQTGAGAVAGVERQLRERHEQEAIVTQLADKLTPSSSAPTAAQTQAG